MGDLEYVQTYVIEEMVGRGTRYQRSAGNYMETVSGRLDLPTDICEWVSPETLALWVQEEVSKLNDGAPAGALPGVLLGVLTFAYARGVFDSEEILSLCQTDPQYRRVGRGIGFTQEQLLSVRHKDRGLLVTLAVRVLTRAVVSKCDVPAGSLPPDLKRRLHENAVDRLDNARHMDRGESV